MDAYGQYSDEWYMGNFFEYNKMMRELLHFQTTNVNNSSTSSSIGAYDTCTFFKTGIRCAFFSCKCKEETPERNELTSSPTTILNHQTETKITPVKDTKHDISLPIQGQYEKVSSLSPIRDEKSVTPVRDEPIVHSVPPPTIINAPANTNDDGRACSYFKKGLPCPFPACGCKCYDVPERLPVLPKKQVAPNTDPNVKLCDYYKYDRPCPFPRCRYKCYSRAEKQQHFDMGYVKPVYNNPRHAGPTNNTRGRDIDHRYSAPSRRDSWEAKCDEFIRNIGATKPSASPPSIEDNLSERLQKKRRSHEGEDFDVSSKKRSKKKRSRERERDEDDKHSSKKKKSKKDKKEKKSKKDKKERSKDKESGSRNSKRSRTKSAEDKASKDGSAVIGENLDNSVIIVSENSEGEKPTFNPSPAFVEFIIKNFRKKSKKKLPVEIQLEGIFKCNGNEVSKESSEEAKIDWITRKTLDFLNSYGYNEDKIYDISTLMEGETLGKELKNVVYNAVKEGKIGHSKAAISQLFHVIELVVKYYIASDETEDEDVAVEKKEIGRTGFTNAEILKQAAQAQPFTEAEEKNARRESENSTNPWAEMAKSIETEDIKSFHGVKRSLAKSLLASGNNDGFDVAFQMIKCWCESDYNLPRLKILISKTQNENLFPPKDQTDSNAQNRDNGKRFGSKKSFLFDTLCMKLSKFRKNLTQEQIEFCVRKTIIYILVGLEGATEGKSRFDDWKAIYEPTKRTRKNQNVPEVPTNEIVYNYLPPGLREAETTKSISANDNEKLPSETSDDSGMCTETSDNHLNDSSKERRISGDGSIDESLSQKRIPKRKYIIGSVFIEWECIEGGRPEVFEISVHFPNMGSLSLHIVTKTMQGHPNLLKENNFVVDPDYSNKFYYVQKGSGFSEAMTFRDAIDSLVNYLEGKRCAKGENENNGIILLFRGFEELAIIVRALEWAGHNDILLDVVKGFGTLETVVQSLEPGKFKYGRPDLEADEESKESFFTANLTVNSLTQKITSKNKAESIHHALELFLKEPPSYENFIQEFCFPSFSNETKQSKYQLKKLEELYFFERYFAANCKDFFTSLRPLPDTNNYGDLRSRRCKDQHDAFAYRICKALTLSGFSTEKLRNRYKENLQFTLNADDLFSKAVLHEMSEDRTEVVIRFCNEKMQNFFLQV